MKKIILAFDGTGNLFSVNNTNVAKLLQAVDRSPSVLTFYESGIGTFPYQGAFSNGRSWLSNLYKQATGAGIRRNIRTAYQYLIDVYEPGDQIYLYGFSRGAYTARALAGLLHDYGLLRKGHDNLVNHVSKFYHRCKQSDDNTKGVPDAVRHEFQRLFTQPCKPHLVGVWDTVGSLGTLYRGEKFVNSKLNKDVHIGLHAMAIHELRKKFPVSVWSNTLEADGITRKDTGKVIKQAWFAGAHADVGGGYEDTALSDPALEWMLKESEAAGLPLRKNWQENIWPKFSPNPKAAKHDEFEKLKWRFFGKLKRQLNEGCHVHRSALEWAEHHDKPIPLPDKYETVS